MSYAHLQLPACFKCSYFTGSSGNTGSSVTTTSSVTLKIKCLLFQ